MKLLSLAPLRAAVARPTPRLAMQTRFASPWASSEATESEADVRADQDPNIKGAPTEVLQEETIIELHERTETEEYHEAMDRELGQKKDKK